MYPQSRTARSRPQPRARHSEPSTGDDYRCLSEVELGQIVRKGCAMPRVSLNRPDLKFDPDDPPGFRCGMWRFGESLGAERVGTTLYEIPPGEAVCPYH
jgi:hypothetical protein